MAGGIADSRDDVRARTTRNIAAGDKLNRRALRARGSLQRGSVVVVGIAKRIGGSRDEKNAAAAICDGRVGKAVVCGGGGG